MNQESTSSMGTMLLALCLGTLTGAIIVALTTPKNGSELRGDMKTLGRRARRKVGDLLGGSQSIWDGMTERRTHTVPDGTMNGLSS